MVPRVSAIKGVDCTWLTNPCISYETRWENLLKYHHILLLIISFILTTGMLDQVVML